MNKKFVKRTILVTLILIITVTGGVLLFSNFQFSVSAANVTVYSYDGEMPFFEYYDSIPADNETSIDCWFDTLPPTDNTSNFCSLNTSVYENINGKTVYVDSFYRDNGDSLKDPNFAQGILLYQCIEYKMAHPEEEVYIDYTEYRMSVTASVCVKRDSKYFGYMRSLFDCEYDSHGFVRIAFMLIEAARLGIHVTFVPQLNSYGVNQYSETTANNIAYKSALSYNTYFNGSINRNCYSGYAAEKKVSDYFTFAKCNWLVSDNGNTDMMHTKMCAVSSYRDYLGNDYSSGVFITSSNLDDNDYLGRNGNTGTQSGIVISNHDEIWNVAHNYVNKLKDYCGAEQSIIFRDIMGITNKNQFDLILQGKWNEIPSSERLVYLGSESDNIFEFYFTPLPGSVGVWNTDYNPYSKYFTDFSQSTDYIELIWCVPEYTQSNIFARTIEELVIEAYHKNLNPENKLVLHLPGYEKAYAYNDLEVGKDIGYYFIGNVQSYVHSKDTIMTYEKDGIRYYTSIITSCNFHLGALYYQSNQFLIIKETDITGHDTYDTMKHAMSYGRV